MHKKNNDFFFNHFVKSTYPFNDNLIFKKTTERKKKLYTVNFFLSLELIWPTKKKRKLTCVCLQFRT